MPKRNPESGGAAPAKWTLMVDDNFHYMDESERYVLGVFDSYGAALAACMKIVDSFLEGEKDRNPEDLYRLYTGFGEDPFILGPHTGPRFSAWEYAKSRCDELAGKKRG